MFPSRFAAAAGEEAVTETLPHFVPSSSGDALAKSHSPTLEGRGRGWVKLQHAEIVATSLPPSPAPARGEGDFFDRFFGRSAGIGAVVCLEGRNPPFATLKIFSLAVQ